MTPEVMAVYASDRARAQSRKGGNYLVAASILHLVSIPIALVILKWLVEGQVGRSVSWGELLDALSVTGGLPILLAGVLGQIAFAVVAAAGALLLYRQRSGVWAPVFASGAVAVAFSLLLFGGFIGIIGGLVSVMGGMAAKPSARVSQLPPPAGPPPYRPPAPP